MPAKKHSPDPVTTEVTTGAAECVAARGASLLTTYPGGKNGAGVYQALINLMPPHARYIEAFLGSGAVLRRKRPAAAANVGIDADEAVIAAHTQAPRPGFRFVCADAVEFLDGGQWYPDDLIYCDPPYLGSSRSSQRPFYRHAFLSASEHANFLKVMTSLRAMVIISGYESPLYASHLKGWNRMTFSAQSRGGPRKEIVWYNFTAPLELHDYRYLGRNHHDRLRIARKVKRLVAKLSKLPPLERAAVIAGVNAI